MTHQLIGSLLLVLVLGATTRAGDDPWKPFRYLEGEWVGEGGGQPGPGTGTFRFAWDLQGHVLVRKGHAEFPAVAGKAASTHDDMMIIHKGGGDSPDRADYFDDKGHVIRYQASISSDGRVVTFLSDPVPNSPRFRLSYTHETESTARIRFEIEPPGGSGFQIYLDGRARRVTPAK
jgi:hypothetical protein